MTLIHHLPHKKIAELFFDTDRIREELPDPDSHVNNIVSYAIDVAKGLLSKMMNLAEIWGLRQDGSNPCRHVKKCHEKGRERFFIQGGV